MQLTVTIPDADVDDLTAYMVKRLLILYPLWDTTGVDVLQVMLDDHAKDRCHESAISVARWAIEDATTGAERTAAEAAENAARDTKIANEATRLAARS